MQFSCIPPLWLDVSSLSGHVIRPNILPTRFLVSFLLSPCPVLFPVSDIHTPSTSLLFAALGWLRRVRNCRVDMVVSMGGVVTVLTARVSMGLEMAGDGGSGP